eukprot:scaffold205655_cov32-Tisochrysis_lutea.AAC.2
MLGPVDLVPYVSGSNIEGPLRCLHHGGRVVASHLECFALPGGLGSKQKSLGTARAIDHPPTPVAFPDLARPVRHVEPFLAEPVEGCNVNLRQESAVDNAAI